MKRILTLATLVVLTTSMLGGCSFIRSKFGNDPNAYKSAREAQPLEVPPGLETPNTSGALAIPGHDAGTAAPIDDLAVPPQLSLGADNVPLGGDDLHVTDTAANTWRRVGLALENSGSAVIETRDEAAGIYKVRANTATSQRAGWFKRAITLGRAADRTVRTQVSLTVRVRADGEASKVVVEGANNATSIQAARDLLEALRQRLS